MSRSVAALLVTHDSAGWIEPTLRSVLGQRHVPDAIVVVDDDSQDDTRAIIERVAGDRATIVRATSRHDDTITRIAHNFHQGIRACIAHEVVVLGDHDDIWHPARIGHQANQLRTHRDIAMLAGDGRLVDAKGRPTGRTLRTAFPVPEAFNTMPGDEQMAYVLRHSVATGGASAVRPAAFADLAIPPGWLHDRWWSLVATARGQLRIDDHQVIDYRLSADQQIGIDTALQQRGPGVRLRHALTNAPSVAARIRDLRGLRAFAANDAIARAVSTGGILAALR